MSTQWDFELVGPRLWLVYYPECPSNGIPTLLGCSFYETHFPSSLPTLISHIQGPITNIPMAPSSSGQRGSPTPSVCILLLTMQSLPLMSCSNIPMGTLAVEPSHGPGLLALPLEGPLRGGQRKRKVVRLPVMWEVLVPVLSLSWLICFWDRSEYYLVIRSAHNRLYCTLDQ